MAPPRRWDDYLVAEHELIERAMAVLEAEVAGLREGRHDLFRLSRSIDFLLEFGDRLHNKKEEEALFPRMEARGIPRQGPIGVMLMEHEAERQLLGRISTDLPALATASERERRTLASDILEYLRTRAAHIWKENDVLYAMGRRLLDEADDAELMEAFAAIDRAHYGEEAAAHFAAMVAELEAGSAATTPLVHNLSHEQLDAIFEALPVEVTFVDARDQVAYFNRLDRPKIFTRTRSAIGRKVGRCHPSKSVGRVQEIVRSFKTGVEDEAEFWIDFRGQKVRITYHAVRSREGAYLGVLEVTQRIDRIQALEGEKRLL